MTHAEWRAVGHGMYSNLQLLVPYFRARDDAEAGAEKKPSPAERQRRRREEAAREQAAQQADRGPGPLYAHHLWIEAVDENLTLPRDIAAAGERLIAWKLRRGCLCAKAGRLECDEEEECWRRVRGEAAVGSRQVGSRE